MQNNRVYKTISEVAQEIGLVNKKNKKPNTHTLRFWEKHFKQIKPKLLSGNRRYYSDKDIKYIKFINEKNTISILFNYLYLYLGHYFYCSRHWNG